MRVRVWLRNGLLTTRELARRPAETAERRSAAGATTRLDTPRALRVEVVVEARMQTGAAVIMAAIFGVVSEVLRSGRRVSALMEEGRRGTL